MGMVTIQQRRWKPLVKQIVVASVIKKGLIEPFS